MGSLNSYKSCDEVPKRHNRLGTLQSRDHDYKLYGYTDSDWVGSATYNKSTSCGCCCLTL